ncbi:CRISPR-associated protein Csm2 [Staphylococcus auricularis]|uniref:type III-A CRISPR-associated protein Csm2 n=1 Tax=Staphylococcus auricularis TaxID=29379 RepID=UPI0019313D73|nr:type III-A CRISPR-associated protein Csm2 [Staphylococcus auricularis]MBM0868307.1 type III-A CRISPR-associated protein Csm2 [Staphylococcus auricularis]MCG7342467.1 type III-A CRISPR-associated protein Csm2 [Staphylococcus auricularis]
MILDKTTDGKEINLEFAHEVVKKNVKTRKNRRGKEEPVLFEGLTTSKLRSLMEQVNRLYTIVFNTNEEKLSESFLDELEYLKIKFYYEAGRERSVEVFLKKTCMFSIIDRVIKKESKKFFLDYCKYFEALVAYSKYYQKED